MPQSSLERDVAFAQQLIYHTILIFPRDQKRIKVKKKLLYSVVCTILYRLLSIISCYYTPIRQLKYSTNLVVDENYVYATRLGNTSSTLKHYYYWLKCDRPPWDDCFICFCFRLGYVWKLLNWDDVNITNNSALSIFVILI